jgi:multicomponent Na+:H+ antiporter subunit D
MIDSGWMPILVVATSLVAGIAIFLIDEGSQRLRSAINMCAATAKLLLVGAIFYGAMRHGYAFEARYQIVGNFDFVLRVDLLSLLFVTLSATLWFVTTIYAIGYLEGSPNRKRFFGFFSLCVTASVGIALAGNLVTFFIFYEFLTLTTYPLVVHRGTPKALNAGRTYLIYTMTGGAGLFLAVVWMHTLGGSFDFGEIGAIRGIWESHPQQAVVLFYLLIASLGVKAALVPLHGWLPVAMVAPAPVSALLHAVAVVKAGAFGILRVVYDVFGVHFAKELDLLLPVAGLAAFTVLYGSIRALWQDDLKRRLAYSTISQIAYIVLGVALFGPLAAIGSLVHLVHQGLMKITLFFCAGNLAETLDIHRVSEMAGIGRRMPWTMAAFTVASFGMIGAPPLAGFISKWYLGLGALEAGHPWVVAVLVASTALNAAYFLPILYTAWFRPPTERWSSERTAGQLETRWTLLLPAVSTAVLSIVTGLFAASPFSPLHLSVTIARHLYPLP